MSPSPNAKSTRLGLMIREIAGVTYRPHAACAVVAIDAVGD